MPRRQPKYRLHQGSGQALVQIDGRRIYLGKHNSVESHEKYHRLIAEWLADQAQGRTCGESAAHDVEVHSPSVSEVMAKYWLFAQVYYSRDGEPTKEQSCMKYALRPLRKLYGTTPAKEFGPLSLKALREHFIEQNLSRGVINDRVNRIRRFFKWAVSGELVPAEVHESLRAISGLKRGRTAARERPPVAPVSDAAVEATLGYLPPPDLIVAANEQEDPGTMSDEQLNQALQANVMRLLQENPQIVIAAAHKCPEWRVEPVCGDLEPDESMLSR